jgi:hypothetical protein
MPGRFVGCSAGERFGLRDNASTGFLPHLAHTSYQASSTGGHAPVVEIALEGTVVASVTDGAAPQPAACSEAYGTRCPDVGFAATITAPFHARDLRGRRAGPGRLRPHPGARPSRHRRAVTQAYSETTQTFVIARESHLSSLHEWMGALEVASGGFSVPVICLRMP